MQSREALAMCDGFSEAADSWDARDSLELNQTGCCDQAQADGIPCPSPECSCESCRRSLLCVGRL